MKSTIGKIAELVGGVADSSTYDLELGGVASIAEAGAGDITFFGNQRYLSALRRCEATAALVPNDFAEVIKPIAIRVENPSVAFAKVLEVFRPEAIQWAPGVHPTAVIGEGVELGEGVSIQAHVVIEAGAKIGNRSIIGANSYVGHRTIIGEDSRLHPLVTVREECIIGNRVAIHSGTVIGSDGFGYEFENGQHVKIPQVGIVQIDDDVEIGSNVSVDRARFGRTWIQQGTKVDNQVQIAHNVVIGRHCVVVAQVGISGSARLGHYVVVAGQAGLAGHISVGDRAIIGARAGISKDVAGDETYMGVPAIPANEYRRNVAYGHRLEQLFDRVKQLEQLLGARTKSSSERS